MDEQQNIIIYRTADGKASVALYARDGKIWLNQQQMAELFATSKPNISMHISNILKERELYKDSVVKDFLTTAADGKNYNVVCTGGLSPCALGIAQGPPRQRPCRDAGLWFPYKVNIYREPVCGRTIQTLSRTNNTEKLTLSKK